MLAQVPEYPGTSLALKLVLVQSVPGGGAAAELELSAALELLGLLLLLLRAALELLGLLLLLRAALELLLKLELLCCTGGRLELLCAGGW
jgi:hypothetical protein